MKFPLLVLIGCLASAGCASRACRDDTSIDSYDAADRQLIEHYRTTPATDSALVRAKVPRYIYRDGCLIDTGGQRWYVIGPRTAGVTTADATPAQHVPDLTRTVTEPAPPTGSAPAQAPAPANSPAATAASAPATATTPAAASVPQSTAGEAPAAEQATQHAGDRPAKQP